MSKKHYILRLLPVGLLLVLLCGIPMVRAAGGSSADDKAKAKYFLNNSLKQNSKDRGFMAGIFMDEVLRLDSTDSYVSFLRAGDTDSLQEALRLMKEYAEANPDDPYAAVPYIYGLAQNGNTDEAFSRLRHLIDRDPENLMFRNMERQVWTYLDSADRAFEVVDVMQSLGVDSADALAYKFEIVLNVTPMDTMRYVGLAEEYAREHPADSVAGTYLAGVYAAVGQRERAYAKVRSYIDRYPGEVWPLMALANLQRNNDSLEAAENTMLEILRIPSLTAADFDFEMIVDAMDSMPRFTRAFSERFASDTIVPQFMLLVYTGNNNFVAADSLLRTMHPVLSRMESVKAAMTTELALERPDSALAIYNDAIDRGIILPENDFLLSLMYSNLKDEEKFLELRDNAVAKILPPGINPDSLPSLPYDMLFPRYNELRSLYSLESDMYHKMGDYDKMLRAARNMLAIQADDAEGMNNVAYYLSESDDRDVLLRALEMSGRSIELSPDLNKFDTMAWLLYKLGRSKEALPLMRAVVAALDDDIPNKSDFLGHLQAIEGAAAQSE